jgi:hypothetical protein
MDGTTWGKKKKAKSEWTQNQIGKKSLQLSGFGFFSSVASFACHQKKEKIPHLSSYRHYREK